MKMSPRLEIYIHYVVFDGQRIKRSSHWSVGQWLDYWGEVAAIHDYNYRRHAKNYVDATSV